jgi:hypothetical protein
MDLRYFIVSLLILVTITGAAWSAAQSVAVEKVTPTVIAGENVGFRVEGLRGSTPVGRIVVMVKERWVEAEIAGGTLPLSTR